MSTIEDWFHALADEIDRRVGYRGGLDVTAFHGIVVDALRMVDKRVRETPVVDTLASGTAIAQRPRALLTITPAESIPTIELRVDTDAETQPMEEPDLPEPFNKNAFLATFQNRLAEIREEARMGPAEFEGVPIWRLERVVAQCAEARSSIEAVERYVAWHLRRDPGKY